MELVMSKKAVYAGSFDPITNGHLDIVERALTIFDEVVLLIAVSPTKKSFLGKDRKKELMEEVFKNEKRVSIDTWDGLLVDYAKEKNITAIVRGLRPTGDFEFEFQMASMNRKLTPEIETVFLMTGENLYYVSSSLVKEVFNHGGEVKEFVPPAIYAELLKKRK
jgi:pantetheine-phosphate adenylyltransferase